MADQQQPIQQQHQEENLFSDNDEAFSQMLLGLPSSYVSYLLKLSRVSFYNTVCVYVYVCVCVQTS
jgi:hypothetical protein